MRFSAACLMDRHDYRKALHRAAQGGGRELRSFLARHGYLFDASEALRMPRVIDLHGGANLAHAIDHKFRSLRGEAHDPLIDGNEYPTVVETIITPGRFLRHVHEAV